jgi:phosphoserine phosphatase
MTSVARVILNDRIVSHENLRQTGMSSFIINKQTFWRIDNPTDRHLQLAYAAIRRGESAGVMPTHAIRPSAIFFDMDATVIEEESLVEIARLAGKETEIDALTNEAMSGQIDFSQSLRARLQILRGLERSKLNLITPTLCTGMHDLSKWCHKMGIKMFLITGGFLELADPVAKKLGFTDFKANRFAWQGDVMQGYPEGTIIDAAGKKQAVIDWCQSLSIDVLRTIAVGDGANDQLMMGACGMAAGFRPKQVLWPQIHIANHTGDHRFLIATLSNLGEDLFA